MDIVYTNTFEEGVLFTSDGEGMVPWGALMLYINFYLSPFEDILYYYRPRSYYLYNPYPPVVKLTGFTVGNFWWIVFWWDNSSIQLPGGYFEYTFEVPREAFGTYAFSVVGTIISTWATVHAEFCYKTSTITYINNSQGDIVFESRDGSELYPTYPAIVRKFSSTTVGICTTSDMFFNIVSYESWENPVMHDPEMGFYALLDSGGPVRAESVEVTYNPPDPIPIPECDCGQWEKTIQTESKFNSTEGYLKTL